jgi:hypothetical protein
MIPPTSDQQALTTYFTGALERENGSLCQANGQESLRLNERRGHAR